MISSIVDLRTIDDKDTDGQLLSLNRTYLPPMNIGNAQNNREVSGKRLDKIKVGYSV